MQSNSVSLGASETDEPMDALAIYYLSADPPHERRCSSRWRTIG
jgi:hypothetical protein